MKADPCGKENSGKPFMSRLPNFLSLSTYVDTLAVRMLPIFIIRSSDELVRLAVFYRLCTTASHSRSRTGPAVQFAIQSFLANAISFSSEKIEASYRCRSISKVVIKEIDLLTVQSWIHSSVECAKTTVMQSNRRADPTRRSCVSRSFRKSFVRTVTTAATMALLRRGRRRMSYEANQARTSE